MSELPNWVYDVVIELGRWHDEHPKLLAEAWPDYTPKPVDDCGCRALRLIPAKVLADAHVIAAYKRGEEQT